LSPTFTVSLGAPGRCERPDWKAARSRHARAPRRISESGRNSATHNGWWGSGPRAEKRAEKLVVLAHHVLDRPAAAQDCAETQG